MPESAEDLELLLSCGERREDGSAAAASGAHDDCVMAMAIALAVRDETAGREHEPESEAAVVAAVER